MREYRQGKRAHLMPDLGGQNVLFAAVSHKFSAFRPLRKLRSLAVPVRVVSLVPDTGLLHGAVGLLL